MNLINWIGTAAGTLTTLAFLPQVIKTWKTHSAGDISLLMFLFFSSGVLLWFVYGLLLDAFPIILANGITLGLSSSILVLKIKDQLSKR